MASSVLPSPAAKDSLSQRLGAAIPIILLNGWAARHQLDHAVAKAMQGGSGFDHMGVGRFLVEQQILTRDQAAELEEVLKIQPLFRDFRISRKLGSGGMGTVFLAEQASSGRQVALKTMNARLAEDKDFVGRFHREAKALLAVKHPNVAEIIDSGEGAGHCWLAMEFIDGPSLMHLLKDYRVLPEAYALRITKQIAEGLGHVWSKAHLVHRDIKPENILVIRNRQGGGDLFPPDDTAKLIDFGLVKAEEKDERLTQTGMTIGTPLYMSPEQVRGEKLDCRSDVYGLGATLYHLLTGFTPFTGTSPGSIMSAHLTEPVPDPGDRVPSLGKSTRELVKMAMAKDFKDRFSTCEALSQAIEEALQQSSGKSGGTLRLLRKPLVLNKPQAQKKPGSDRVQKPPQPDAIGESSGGSRPATGRETRPPTSRETRPPSTRVVGPGTDRTDRSEQPTTERMENPGEPQPVGGMKPPTSNRLERSKVFDEDPNAKLHVGILPWIVLALVVVAGLLLLVVLTR